MARLFDRQYNAIIGKRDEQGTLIKGLRCAFSIEKTLEQIPNNARFEIYNISKSTRAQIEDKRGLIIFNVAYGKESALKTLFIGDIASITTRRNGPDIISTIETGDGEVPYANAKLDVSFNPGASFRQVFDTVKSSFGLTEGQVKGINEGDRFLNGLTLSGQTKEAMNMLMQRQNLTWSIQNNQLQVLPVTESTDEVVVVLNRDSGLIGSPYRTKILNQDLLRGKDGVNTNSGISCLSLMNPEIKPGRRVKVESDFVEGFFKVERCRYVGDTHGQPWYVQIEAIE